MKYSVEPCSVMIGPGCSSLWDGKSVMSFSRCGHSCETWNNGVCLEAVGSSSLYVKLSGYASSILYGPSYLAMNFAMQPSFACIYSLQCFAVASMTWSPMLNKGSGSRSLFAWCTWEIFAASMLLRALQTLFSIDSIRVWALSPSAVSLISDKSLRRGGSSCGEHPIFRMKGENPVEAFTVFMISNLTFGSAFAHPCWFHSMWYHRH